jgi:hypothetical protein
MLEYLEKFNNLPSDVKEKISSGAVLEQIEELESKYGVALANFVIRVMVGDVYYKNITANLIIEFNLAPETAAALAKELQDRVFDSVLEFLSGGKAAAEKPKAVTPVAALKAVAPMQAVPVIRRPVIVETAAVKPAIAEAAVLSKPVAVPVAPIKPVAEPINFLEEDKKDISEMAAIAASLRPAPQGKNEILLAEIVKEANISFASEILQKRFQDILVTYLRAIRTKVEVRERLIKDISLGGLRMSEEDADRVLNIAQKKMLSGQEKSPAKVSAKTNASGTNFIFNAEEIKQALSQKNNVLTVKPASNLNTAAERDVPYDFSTLKNQSPVVKIPESKPAAVVEPVIVKKEDLPKPPVKINPSIAPVKPIEKAAPQKISEPPIIESAPAAVLPKKEIPDPAIEIPKSNLGAQNIASLRNDDSAAMGNKKKMEDIKPAPRIMSPIDELAYMDLVNFRRLDSDPARRTAKIEEKIALLEKEGIDKKIEGISAWRNNPVSKTYLAMGRESIGSTKSIDDIIKERKDQGLNYLSKEEFEAVMDLNNNLRF